MHNWEKKSGERQKIYKQFLQKADKNEVLKQLPDLHEEAFSKINCLECAACCKNYSPRFKTPDLKRIAKHLKMKEGDFIEKYLVLDNEGDYVVKTKPCPFLGSDNYCGIYEVRPPVWGEPTRSARTHFSGCWSCSCRIRIPRHRNPMASSSRSLPRSARSSS